MSELKTSRPPLETVIVGSGFSGLCMAIQLRKRGRSFLILEQAPEIGGTWRDNTYPGCACDIPSALYSFSFEPNPEWSRFFPTQPELWEYMKHCADKYELKNSIRFNTKVRETIYDKDAQLWRVYTEAGEIFTARFLACALGPLSRPAIPPIPGAEKFQGKVIHSARWDHTYELRGKRVAVIGTGASAIQFVPQIAPIVEELYVFQRTPPWILPKKDPLMPAWAKRLFRVFPWAQRFLRRLIYWHHECRAFVLASGNHTLLKLVEGVAQRHLEKSISDPALRERLRPDHRIGCKRILLSNDYYPALTRANVALVTDGIREIREHSIVTNDDSERGVDAIVYGTGFIYPSLLAPLRIVGVDGVDLNDAWRGRAQAYLGLTVAGYPNFFMLTGPNSTIGYTSLLFMIEAQVHYVLKCLDVLRAQNAATFDVRLEAQEEFNRRLQARMRRTVWASGCRSRYLDENGVNTTLWPGFTCDYWRQTRRVKTEDYLLSPMPQGS